MSTTTVFSPDTLLSDALQKALTEHGIPHEFWNTGGSCTALKILTADGGEISLCDVNAQVDDSTLAQYSGLQCAYSPTWDGESDYVDLYSSPDLGRYRDMAAFSAELADMIAAIELCRRMCAVRSARSTWKRRQRIAPPQPAETLARLHRRADGFNQLTVVTPVRMDAEAIAAKLYATYWATSEIGEELPDLTRSQVLDILGRLTAECADGWHESLNGPGHRAHEETEAWARAQVTRLYPELSWPER
ncbi:hypothetical protein [Kitasatospora indigofera]|uniref:hypothetical protein n=1 Tax=Kitasatospora indigofera TaxID=67307 RepID=UPI0036A1FADC